MPNLYRWKALKPLLGAFRIQCISEILRPENGGIVEIPARRGGEILQVATLPWIPLRYCVTAGGILGLEEEPYTSYSDAVSRLIKAMCAPLRDDACTPVSPSQ